MLAGQQKQQQHARAVALSSAFHLTSWESSRTDGNLALKEATPSAACSAGALC